MKVGYFSNPTNPTKGFQLILKAIEKTPHELIQGHRLDHGKALQKMNQCDCVALPTITYPEPLSRILVEAMSLGKPTLAFDLGGNSDAIQNGYNGILAQYNDSMPEKDLVRGLKQGLFLISKYKNEMGMNALKLYTEKFKNSIDDIVKEYHLLKK